MSALEDPLLEAIGDTEISAIPKGMVFEPFWRIRRVQVLTVFFWPKKKVQGLSILVGKRTGVFCPLDGFRVNILTTSNCTAHYSQTCFSDKNVIRTTLRRFCFIKRIPQAPRNPERITFETLTQKFSWWKVLFTE